MQFRAMAQAQALGQAQLQAQPQPPAQGPAQAQTSAQGQMAGQTSQLSNASAALTAAAPALSAVHRSPSFGARATSSSPGVPQQSPPLPAASPANANAVARPPSVPGQPVQGAPVNPLLHVPNMAQYYLQVGRLSPEQLQAFLAQVCDPSPDFETSPFLIIVCMHSNSGSSNSSSSSSHSSSMPHTPYSLRHRTLRTVLSRIRDMDCCSYYSLIPVYIYHHMLSDIARPAVMSYRNHVHSRSPFRL